MRAKFRWFTIALALLVGVYSATLTAIMPHPGFNFETQSDGTIVVYDPVSGSAAATKLHTGDIILAINDWPTDHVVDWHWLFPPRPSYQYLVKRETRVFEVSVPTVPVSSDVLINRLLPHFIALCTILVGALMIGFAASHNQSAWEAGATFMALGLTLSGAAGSVYFVPGAFTLFHGLALMGSASYAELALYPRLAASPPVNWKAWKLTKALAITFTVLSLYEIAAYYPVGHEISLGNVSLSRWRLALLSVGLLANPIILYFRYTNTPRSEYRQQARTLLAGTAIALLPTITLLLIPQIVGLDTTTILGPFAYGAPLSFIVFLPVTYGYVIHRHRYLQLDLFITRTIAASLLTVLALTGYCIFTALIPRTWSTIAIYALACASVLPAIYRPARIAAETLLYGRPTYYMTTNAKLIQALADSPDIENIRKGINECLQILQVREAALWLGTEREDFRLVSAWQTQPSNWPKHISLPRSLVLHSSTDNAQFWTQSPWAFVLAPLKASGQTVGLLALGPRIPDEDYAPHQLAFVESISKTLGLGAHAMQLFEATRAMARQLIQAQTIERARLAAEIHDDPIQRITLVANDLGDLAAQLTPTETPFADRAQTNQQNLRKVASDLRAICAGLRPPALDTGMEVAVRDTVYAFQSSCSALVHVRIQLNPASELPDDLVVAAYHILAEALHNIRKHANAKQVWIEFLEIEAEMRIVICDDGCGLPFQKTALAELIRAGHFGLAGMYEWARLADGGLRIETPPQGGTRVIANLPVRSYDNIIS